MAAEATKPEHEVKLSLSEAIDNAIGNFFLGKERKGAPFLNGLVGGVGAGLIAHLGGLGLAVGMPVLAPILAGLAAAGLFGLSSALFDVRRIKTSMRAA